MDYYLNYDFSFLNKYKNLSYTLMYDGDITNYYIYLSNILTYNNIYNIYKYINSYEKTIDSNNFKINYYGLGDYFYKIYYDLNKSIYIGVDYENNIIKKIILNKNIIIHFYNNILDSKYYQNNIAIYYNSLYIYKNYFIYNNIIKINIYQNCKKILYQDFNYSYNNIKDIYTLYNKYKIYYKMCNEEYIKTNFMYEDFLIKISKCFIQNKILTNYKLFFII